MSDLESRIERLERRAGATSQRRDVKVLTDDELAVIITGDPDAKASDLSDADLKAALDKYAAEHPDTHIITVVSEEAKQVTEWVLSGGGT